MQRQSILWAYVAGLFCAAGSFAAQQASVGGGDMLGMNQEQQCVSRCAEQAKVRITQCLQAGGAQRDCLAQGPAFQRECEQACRSGKTCEERCRKLAARAQRRCLADGGSEEECAQLAHEVFENCVREHCPPPPQTCENECERRAIEVLHACVEEGGTQEDCAMRARMFLRHCLDENCNPPAGCRERCEQDAHAVLRICLEMGGTQEDCAERARHHLEECIKAHCPPPTCEEHCAHRALLIYRECLESGGDPDDCAGEARELYNNCVRETCSQDAPCEERCRRYAAGVKRLCLEMGGGEADCEARAQEAGQQCLAQCPTQCGTIAGIPCEKGQFCLFPAGTCDVSDNAGVCVPVPTACPDVWQPVCGCDGVTYSNRCEAIMAQVQIAHEGLCQGQPCGGPDAAPCEEGCFCWYPRGCGENGASGVCREIPPAGVQCTDEYLPVCGCDGVTYSNDCQATLHMQSTRHEGTCEDRCGGIAGLPCEDGEFCFFPIGTCDVSDNAGVCVIIPTACPEIWQPVCGCDGVTYGNRCEAIIAGAQIAHVGPCEPQACGGPDGAPCGEGFFCAYEAGSCGNDTTAGGFCRDIPDACPLVYMPVCGCDGKTYGNECEAAMAMASIMHEGPCEVRLCGGDMVRPPCPDGFFCHHEAGGCGTSDQPGVCQPVPDGCPRIFDPVCGCDGVTYSNKCEAAMNSQSIRHEGPCEPDRCGGLAGLPCDKGEFCKYPPGTCGCCDIFGVCTPVPLGCPDHVEPVCGCDGITYFNPCEAAAAGVNISHPGPCEQGCDANEDCGEHQFCMKRPGDCDAATPGVCAMRPQMCPEFYAPVCGCDGHTYANPCFAAHAGASIAHQGPCED